MEHVKSFVKIMYKWQWQQHVHHPTAHNGQVFAVSRCCDIAHEFVYHTEHNHAKNNVKIFEYH